MSAAFPLDPCIGTLLVAAFALLFVHAALGKWRSLAEFSAVLGNYRLTPAPLVGALSVVVASAETATALLLLATPTRAWGAAVGGALLLAYAGAIAVNLRRGRVDLDCGCAGPGHRRPIAQWMVWRNLLLAAALAVAGQPWAPRVLDATDMLTAGGGLAVIALLYVSLDRLLGQVMPRSAALRGRL